MAGLGGHSFGYSRIVGVLKILLPLTALVLLSLVFLLARTIDPTQAISMASIDVEDRARDPRLSGARFAGVTDDGAALTIDTETARSDPNVALRLEVTGLAMHLEGAAGETMIANAESGVLDRDTGRFEMRGGLTLQATPGYNLTTEEIVGLMDSTLIEALSPLSGTAPVGDFSAGTMTMRADSSDGAGYMLVFGGGVRLLYHPEN